jgi:hypothetical protein
MIRLTYVSRSAIAAGRHGCEFSDMIAVAKARNAALGVTGALIHVQGYFAQVLEGNRDDIEELMVSIRRDPRHGELEIAETCAITERSFKSWMLAYDGDAVYIEHQVRAALGGGGLVVAAGPLLQLFEKLSEAGGVHHGSEREVRSVSVKG